jgi:hypothetical protein
MDLKNSQKQISPARNRINVVIIEGLMVHKKQQLKHE